MSSNRKWIKVQRIIIKLTSLTRWSTSWARELLSCQRKRPNVQSARRISICHGKWRGIWKTAEMEEQSTSRKGLMDSQLARSVRTVTQVSSRCLTTSSAATQKSKCRPSTAAASKNIWDFFNLRGWEVPSWKRSSEISFCRWSKIYWPTRSHSSLRSLTTPSRLPVTCAQSTGRSGRTSTRRGGSSSSSWLQTLKL